MAKSQHSYKTTELRIPLLADKISSGVLRRWAAAVGRPAGSLLKSWWCSTVHPEALEHFGAPNSVESPVQDADLEAALHYPRCVGSGSKRLASSSLCGSACRENPQSTTSVSCTPLSVEISGYGRMIETTISNAAVHEGTVKASPATCRTAFCFRSTTEVVRGKFLKPTVALWTEIYPRDKHRRTNLGLTDVG